jgi:hypothetical protein
MVATTATDDSGVEYYFTCVLGGGNDSIWQDETFYEDVSLDPNTEYCYTVKARDKSPSQNTTAASSSGCATTDPISGGPQIFYDDFEDADMVGWTVIGSAGPSAESVYEGTYSVKLKITASIETAFSTVGYTNIHFKYARSTNSSLDAGEYLTADWYDGADWNIVEQVSGGDPWAEKDWALPSGAANNANFKIRFSINADKNTEFGFVDIIEVTGTQ